MRRRPGALRRGGGRRPPRADRRRPPGRGRARSRAGAGPREPTTSTARAEEVALFTLELDAINFGSGWFPTIRKRPGCSGSITIARALTEHGPWTRAELERLDAAAVAAVLGQDPGHELMALYARALRELGAFLAGRTALGRGGRGRRVGPAPGAQLADGLPMFADPGFYKRAQILPADLALAGVAEFGDLDELTIFADNLVPHVLRVDGVLAYDDALAARIDCRRAAAARRRPSARSAPAPCTRAS